MAGLMVLSICSCTGASAQNVNMKPRSAIARTGVPENSAHQRLMMGFYMLNVQKKLKQSWVPPKGHEFEHVTVAFKINKAGEVSDVHIERGCGVPLADMAAIDAVKRVGRLEPLPAFAPDPSEVKFTFDRNVFSGAHRN